MDQEEKKNTCQKLWGGRFQKSIDPLFHNLNASIDVDKRMFKEDIQGSMAYARAICKAKLLSEEETTIIVNGLQKIYKEWAEDRFEINPTDEDIHSANERRLFELVGDVAKKLHTGRSRNDQAVTDTKLWLRGSIDELLVGITQFVEVLVRRAEQDIDVLIPGYTHLQRAQPVKWSHWLLSYAWSAKEDAERLKEIRKRVNVLPLGSGAIAGSPFEIDRQLLAVDLDFEAITQNSMHAVADRDFVAEFLFWSALTSVHLSRLAEDLILYNTEEFGFLKLSDEYSTGSSLMPQKHNPDSMELIRGKSGTVLGKCVGFMTTLKGLSSTYNKDLQEDKEALFSTFDVLKATICVAGKVVETLILNDKKCNGALTTDMLATDLAYYLVRKGTPFREAHHAAGRVVSLAETEGVSLCELSLNKLQTISKVFEHDVTHIWNIKNSVEQYKVTGGTSTNAVKQQIQNLREWLQRNTTCESPQDWE